MTSSTLTHFKVIALAVPVMLAQAATASTGVVDTAVMGLTGDKVELGAVGVAAVRRASIVRAASAAIPST